MKIKTITASALAVLTVMTAGASVANAYTYTGYTNTNSYYDNSYSTGYNYNSITKETAKLQQPFVHTVTKKYDGIDGVKLIFQFSPSEGNYGFADGYEAKVCQKYRTEKNWRQAEIFDVRDTDDCGEPEYITGAQDDFEFAVKIRAYYEVNGRRIYSDWSKTSYGDTRM